LDCLTSSVKRWSRPASVSSCSINVLAMLRRRLSGPTATFIRCQTSA
jgi:hypothetical protein